MELTKNQHYLLRLLSATALSTFAYITPAFAAGPDVATVVDSVNFTLTTISNSADDGVSVIGGGTGIVMDVTDSIDTTNIGVSALDNGADISITLNADVTSTQTGVGATADDGSVTVTGSGNVTSGNASEDLAAGIAVITSGIGDILVSGTGATTSTGVVGRGNVGIFTFSNDGSGNTTITRSGTISGVGVGIYATVAHSASNTDSLIITDIGDVSASADNSATILMLNTTQGALTLNTSNAIINTGSGYTLGVNALTLGSLTNITVGDITMDSASTGIAIMLTNGGVGTNSTSININGTITSGDVSAGAKAIGGLGHQDVGMNLTIASTGVVNGIINIDGSNDGTSTFQNNGVWNGYGATSTFSGSLNNNGTMNFQDDAATSKVDVSGGVALSSASVIKVDARGVGNTDYFEVTAGEIVPDGRLNVNAIGAEALIVVITADDITLDGTLEVNAIGAEALFSATNGITYTLFENNGSSTASGSFATLTEDLAFIDLAVNIVSDEVLYEFVTKAIDFKPHANGSNQYNAAEAMDDFDYTSTEGQAIKAVFGALTNDEADDAIKQISGGDHQGAFQSGAGIASGFRNAMMGGTDGDTNGGDNSEPQVTGYTVSATGDAPAIGIGIWARAMGGYAKLDKGTTAADLTTSTFGVVGGADYYINDDTTIGLSTGYTRADFSVQTTGSSSYADNFHAGVSGHLGASSAFDTGFGLSAGADATLHNYHTKRNIAIGAVTSTATSDYSGITIGGTASARYGMEIDNNIILSSIAGIDASQTRNDAFAETGAGLLNISTDASSSQKLGSNIGFGLAGKVGDISAAISAAWRHEFADVNHTTTNNIAGSPTSYTTTTPTEARNKIMLNANVALPLSDNSSVTFSTYGDLSRTTVNVGASASYKLKF